MKRLMIVGLSALAIAIAVAPIASASNARTDTCPTGSSQCVGSGGAAD